ncbi:MAG TPA: hypothetical protein VHD56_07385 [Tepidisphaeraceae bacterium]|nr:hypothetical protein [Tepidisphaeraceae bacterium]
MSLPVTIESDALRVELYPQFGGKVLSIVDKADDYELMFDYAAEFPTTCQYDQPYSAAYCAGWDECFPAVAPGPYPAHPYKGISIPDHGELWSLPTTAVPTKDGITTEWQGLRFGYRLVRALSVIGSRLLAEYTLYNTSPFDLHFVWAMHSLSSMHQPVEIALPRGTYRLSHDSEGKKYDSPYLWPSSPVGEDLSQPANLPSRRGWKSFSNEPINGPARVWYPSRNRSLTIEYASSDGLAAYWGLWINTGGWAGYRHFAIEPTTGRYDELDRSSKDGSAGMVAPLSKITWQVKWSVGDTRL